jgi:hypothetical protein
MKLSRLERISDSVFSRLDPSEQSHLVGAATFIVRITGPFTSPLPGGQPDGGREDILPDVG